MSRRLHTIATAVVLAASLGMHWAVLQTVAWAGMLVDYSADGPLAEAVAKTFNGKNPCKLCIAVDRGRHAEQTPDGVLKVHKLDLLCQAPVGFVIDGIPANVSVTPSTPPVHFLPPPTPPPPRAA